MKRVWLQVEDKIELKSQRSSEVTPLEFEIL
jgi:hypothetical protein